LASSGSWNSPNPSSFTKRSSNFANPVGLLILDGSHESQIRKAAITRIDRVCEDQRVIDAGGSRWTDLQMSEGPWSSKAS
jgi:hypothetical protein